MQKIEKGIGLYHPAYAVASVAAVSTGVTSLRCYQVLQLIGIIMEVL